MNIVSVVNSQLANMPLSLLFILLIHIPTNEMHRGSRAHYVEGITWAERLIPVSLHQPRLLGTSSRFAQPIPASSRSTFFLPRSEPLQPGPYDTKPCAVLRCSPCSKSVRHRVIHASLKLLHDLHAPHPSHEIPFPLFAGGLSHSWPRAPGKVDGAK